MDTKTGKIVPAKKSVNMDTAKIVVLAIVLGASVSFAIAEWSEPAASPIQGGLPVVLHGGSTQYKQGSLTVNTAGALESTGLFIRRGSLWVGATERSVAFGAGIDGSVGATAYCNIGGSSCVTTESILSDVLIGGGALPSGTIFMFEGNCPSGWVSRSDPGGTYYLRSPVGAETAIGSQGGNGGYHNHTTPGLAGPVHAKASGSYPWEVVAQAGTAYRYSNLPVINLRFCAAP